MRDTVGSREAANIVGVPYTTFMRWVADGRITPVHENPGPVGAKIFSRADVERLAADRKTVADECVS
jgi:predicted site-specific integrase-resolvase